MINKIKKVLKANSKTNNNVNSVCLEISFTRDIKTKKDTFFIHIDGNKISDGYDSYYSLEMGIKLLNKSLRELSNEKGFTNLVVDYEDINLSRDWVSNYVKFPRRIILLSKPCAEFTKLIKYINKYTNKDIPTTSIYRVYIGGKRGRVYGEEDERHYLAFDSKRCLYILNELKSARNSKDTMTISNVEVKDVIDDMELKYSIQYETEFNGMRYSGYIIKINTPSGKLKKEIRLGC